MESPVQVPHSSTFAKQMLMVPELPPFKHVLSNAVLHIKKLHVVKLCTSFQPPLQCLTTTIAYIRVTYMYGAISVQALQVK